jgi:hypothetical protein
MEIRKKANAYNIEYKQLLNSIERLKEEVFERLKFLSKKYPETILIDNITSEIILSTTDRNSISLETQINLIKIFETMIENINNKYVQKQINFEINDNN